MQLRSAEAPRGVTSRYHMPITTFFFFIIIFFFSWKWKLGHRINATKDTRILQNSEESDIPKLHYFTLLAIKIKQSSLESSIWNDRLNSWAYYVAFKGWDFLKRASIAGVGQSVCVCVNTKGGMRLLVSGSNSKPWTMYLFILKYFLMQVVTVLFSQKLLKYFLYYRIWVFSIMRRTNQEWRGFSPPRLLFSYKSVVIWNYKISIVC